MTILRDVALSAKPIPPIAAMLLCAAAPAHALEFRLPVLCEIGTQCMVQNYVDRDPGEGATDFRCGSQTYDGHDGTDIRVPTLRHMAVGVTVVAAADGVVAAFRDDMEDISVNDADPTSVKDRECGNGVLIEHGEGWVTQYCHMKEGSIRVAKGERVAAGMPLGEIGLSGNTEFPHLHFEIRKDEESIDPFAARPAAGAACPVAGDESTSLWAAEAKAQLAYRPAQVLNAGFAGGPVTMDQVESGEFEDFKLTSDAPALVFFGRAIGLEKGDRQRIALVGPDGQPLAGEEIEPLDRSKAQFFAFVGKKRSEAPWPAGTYRGRYSVIRGDAEIASREATATVSK